MFLCGSVTCACMLLILFFADSKIAETVALLIQNHPVVLFIEILMFLCGSVYASIVCKFYQWSAVDAQPLLNPCVIILTASVTLLTPSISINPPMCNLTLNHPLTIQQSPETKNLPWKSHCSYRAGVSGGPLVPRQPTVNSSLFPREWTMRGDGPVGSCPCNSTNSRLRTLIRDDAMVYVVSCSFWAIMTACLGGCQCIYLTAMSFDKRVAPCYWY